MPEIEVDGESGKDLYRGKWIVVSDGIFLDPVRIWKKEGNTITLASRFWQHWILDFEGWVRRIKDAKS
jgi:hypothetical protein